MDNKATSPARCRALGILCLAAAFVLAFYGQLRTGATTSDDLYYEQNVITGHLGALSAELAVGAGRFHHYLHVGLTALPYHLDSEPVRKALSLTIFAAAMAGVTLVAGTIAGLPSVGLLALLFAVVFYQDNWHHNILSSYPLVFDSGLLCVAATAFCLWRHGRSGRRGLLVLANGLAFAAYCHFEAFLCYAPLFCAVIWLAGEKNTRPPGNRIQTMLLANIGLVAYLAITVAYRATHPTHYDGNALDLTRPLRIVRTILAYSQSALPLGAFSPNLDLINRFPVITRSLVLDFPGYLRQLAAGWPQFSPGWSGLALITGGLTFQFLTRDAGSSRPRLRPLAVLTVLYAAYCPNFLIALSPKYQEPAMLHGITWYVTSTFSAYAWAIALALACVWLTGRLGPGRRGRTILAGCLAGLAAATALVNASVNASVRESKIAAAARWRMAAVAVKSPVFDALPEGTVLVAPDLFTAVRVEITRPGYWEDWFAHRTGKRLRVLPALDPADPPVLPVYALRRLSAPTARETDVLLARVPRLGPPDPDPYAPCPDQPILLADTATVLSDATNAYPDILYEDAGTWRLTPAMAIGPRGLAQTVLTGQAIPVSSLVLVPGGRLSTASSTPSLLRLRFARGFTAPERSITGPIVWAGNDGELLLSNSDHVPVRARLDFSLVALAPVRLRATGPGVDREIVTTGLSTDIHLSCLLPPGASRLTLQALLPLSPAGKRFGLVGAALSPDTPGATSATPLVP